jgi:hypothetical protein
MFHHVYANDRSICCKAGEGASKAAFPDTCWTPPQPTPAPIPYPNTAFTSDLTNGSKTVFIQGSEVAKKDVSYFATSTGDEPATSSCGQGVLTGVIQGKAYFFSWSMNVSVEQHNVCRHLDLMGHNHASSPTNTPLFPFLERSWGGSHDCHAEEKRIKKACKKEEEEKDEQKKKLKPKKKRRFNLSRKKSKSGPDKKEGAWHWTDDHCDGLELKPSLTAAEDMLKEAEEAIKELDVEQALIDKAKNELYDFLQKAALKGGGKILVKALGKQAAGSWLPVIGNIAMGLWTVYDIYSTYQDIDQLKELYDEVVDYVDTLKQKLGDFKSFLDRYKKEGASEALMADVMDVLATINACTRYRKCMLVPYRNKYGGGDVEPANRGGCCPGQTGHHLIPDALTKNGACPGYNKRDAPVVCVEGKNQYHGSHGRVHNMTDLMIRGLAGKGGTIATDKAIAAAVTAHQISFPLSKCSADCIKAQLEAYYNSKCPNTQLPAVDKQGNTVQGDTVEPDELLDE